MATRAEGAGVPGRFGELLAHLANRGAGMGGRRAARDGRAARPPAGRLRDSPETGGAERRRHGELGRGRPPASGVLRAPERGGHGAGGRLPRLTSPPAFVSGRQRGGAGADGSRRFVLLLGVPVALFQLLPALLPSPVASRRRLLAFGQEKERRRARRRPVLLVPGEEEQARARAGEREEGAGTDGSERASEGGDRAARRGGAEDAQSAHRETRQHQEVKKQQEEERGTRFRNLGRGVESK